MESFPVGDVLFKYNEKKFYRFLKFFYTVRLWNSNNNSILCGANLHKISTFTTKLEMND